jgi:lipocalin-like protein
MKARNKPKPARTSVGSPVGTWKLVSCVWEDVQTKERTLPYGEHPKGYAILTPEGRLMALITAEGREAPRTAEDRDVAFRSAVAYSGRYRVDGNQFVTTVDIAWNEAWVGTDQVRSFRVEGDRLHIESPPTPNLNRGGQMIRGMLIWEREKEIGFGYVVGSGKK